MSLSLIENEEEEQLQTEGGIPVCGATNLSSPVVDTAYHNDEIHYKIGNRLHDINTITIYAIIEEISLVIVFFSL
jgi:hypothetical protein